MVRGAQGARAPPIEMLPIIKMSQKRLLFFQFQFLLASLRTIVINNNIDPGGLGPFNLIFANQLKWASTIIFKWSPYNNIDLGSPGPLNLFLASQLKWAPTIIFEWAPTIMLIRGARLLTLIFANQLK